MEVFILYTYIVMNRFIFKKILHFFWIIGKLYGSFVYLDDNIILNDFII